MTKSTPEIGLPMQSPPPPARNPRRLSKPIQPQPTPCQSEAAPEIKEETEEKEEEKEEEPVYLLQPKTYTPQTSPLPSPRVFDCPKPKDEPVSHKPESPVPIIEEPKEQTLEAKVYSREPTLEAKVYKQEPKLEAKVYDPRAAQPQLRPQPSKPKLAPADTRDSRPTSKQSHRTTPESPQLRAQPSKPKLAPVETRNSTPTSKESHRISPSSLPEVVVHPEQRSSFRQRVSQKTTPPDSILIPRPDSPEYRDSLFPSARTYQTSDSAYGSDMERPPVNSIASFDTVADFPPPPALMHPGFVSSPHSESGMQFWRPVQASPHSPLQQRPHTSGTQYSVQGQPQSPYQSPQQPVTQLHQVPPRNLPSAMGMSVRSNMTTASQETNGGGKSLKKKRSAFGWLKKAFALDEEERAAFEARRQMETKNLYYDGRSAQFLDGKRIQAPLPRVPGQYPPGPYQNGPYQNGPYQSQQFQQSGQLPPGHF